MDKILDYEGLKNEDSRIISNVKWWESRRLLFNIIVGLSGMLAGLSIYTLDDFFIGIWFVLFYGIIVNLFYTLGWVLEVLNIIYFDGKYSVGEIKGALFFVGTSMSVLITVFLCFAMYPTTTHYYLD